MSFNIEIEIIESTSQEHKEAIEENLYDGVIRMGIFPRPKMGVKLLNGTIIFIENVLPLQMFDKQQHHAIALVSYWEHDDDELNKSKS